MNFNQKLANRSQPHTTGVVHAFGVTQHSRLGGRQTVSVRVKEDNLCVCCTEKCKSILGCKPCVEYVPRKSASENMISPGPGALVPFLVFEMPEKIVILVLIASGLMGLVVMVAGKECDTDGPQRCWMINNGEVMVRFSFKIKYCFQ